MIPKKNNEEEREIEIAGGEESRAADQPAPDSRASDDPSGKGAKHDKHRSRRHKASSQELVAELETVSEELDRVQTELEETKDKFLRGLADFDNYRKRVARERAQLTRCANEDLIKQLLDVVDNIERALKAASDTDDLEGFKKGIELIYEHLKGVLTKEGLCPIVCLGEPFDPNYHEAVMALEKEGHESDRVVEEIQKGYLLDGRVIRPSKVVVSK
ncbi:MAG: nucleotide exchange factor GrpE [bacterium]